jgi:membrane-associated phospholipid phosphatase
MKRHALIVAVVAGLGFLAMVGFMQVDPDDYAAIDTAATAFVHHFQTLPWVQFFVVITTIGNTASIIALGLLVAFFLRKDRVLVTRLVVLLLGESASVQFVKSEIHRVRPDALPFIGTLHSFSFPSGHATAAMALFGFIAIVWVYRLRARRSQAAVIVVMALLILGIGLSRIVLAAHYFSDVLAGYVLGVFWLALVFALPFEKVKWLRRKSVEAA